jgi:hypothetical protein
MDERRIHRRRGRANSNGKRADVQRRHRPSWAASTALYARALMMMSAIPQRLVPERVRRP